MEVSSGDWKSCKISTSTSKLNLKKTFTLKKKNRATGMPKVALKRRYQETGEDDDSLKTKEVAYPKQPKLESKIESQIGDKQPLLEASPSKVTTAITQEGAGETLLTKYEKDKIRAAVEHIVEKLAEQKQKGCVRLQIMRQLKKETSFSCRTISKALQKAMKDGLVKHENARYYLGEIGLLNCHSQKLQ